MDIDDLSNPAQNLEVAIDDLEKHNSQILAAFAHEETNHVKDVFVTPESLSRQELMVSMRNQRGRCKGNGAEAALMSYWIWRIR